MLLFGRIFNHHNILLVDTVLFLLLLPDIRVSPILLSSTNKMKHINIITNSGHSPLSPLDQHMPMCTKSQPEPCQIMYNMVADRLLLRGVFSYVFTAPSPVTIFWGMFFSLHFRPCSFPLTPWLLKIPSALLLRLTLSTFPRASTFR